MEQAKSIVMRHFDAGWIKKDPGKAYALVADEAVVRLFGTELRGREAWAQLERQFHTAFPDLETTVEFVIAEGDKVAVRWRARGTHTAAFQGVPPSGRDVAISGCAVYRVVNERIVEGWAHPDMLGLMQQLGALPR
jgi:steroid delta-isomerase-like uncharacterized protein